MGPLLYIIRARANCDARRIWQFMALCAGIAWLCNLIADRDRRDIIGSAVVLVIEIAVIAYRHVWFVFMVIAGNDYCLNDGDRAWCDMYTEIPTSVAQAISATVCPRATKRGGLLPDDDDDDDDDVPPPV